MQQSVDPQAQALQALELAALKEAIEDKKSGRKLSREQLRLIERLSNRREEPDAGDPSAQLAARPGLNPACLRWVKVSECALELNVTEVWLRNWVHGKKKCSPPLPHKLVHGVINLQPAVAYEHIKAHAAKGSPEMRAPAGYVDAAAAAALPDLFANIDLSGNPHELLAKIMTDKTLLMGLPESKIRAVVAAASELGRDRERQARMAGAIKADKVLEMLRALVFNFANLIHERATARSAALLRFIHAEFAVDLAKTQPAACSLLADQLRTQAQDDVTALHEELRQQTEGIRLPEVEPEGNGDA